MRIIRTDWFAAEGVFAFLAIVGFSRRRRALKQVRRLGAVVVTKPLKDFTVGRLSGRGQVGPLGRAIKLGNQGRDASGLGAAPYAFALDVTDKPVLIFDSKFLGAGEMLEVVSLAGASWRGRSVCR